MTMEANKALLRRFSRELEQNNFEIIEELYAPDYLSHNYDAPDGERPGIEGVKQGFQKFKSAFPDLRIVEEDLIAEGDRVVHRVRYQGTHQGEFFGIPPTGNQVTGSTIEIYRFADGKVVEKWSEFDRLSLLQQLGVSFPL
jgi:steroid delta-isomerase-like uncharacterized protein